MKHIISFEQRSVSAKKLLDNVPEPLGKLLEFHCKIQVVTLITDEVLDNVVRKTANSKPGIDMPSGVLIQRLKSITKMYKE